MLAFRICKNIVVVIMLVVTLTSLTKLFEVLISFSGVMKQVQHHVCEVFFYKRKPLKRFRCKMLFLQKQSKLIDSQIFKILRIISCLIANFSECLSYIR